MTTLSDARQPDELNCTARPLLILAARTISRKKESGMIAVYDKKKKRHEARERRQKLLAHRQKFEQANRN